MQVDQIPDATHSGQHATAMPQSTHTAPCFTASRPSTPQPTQARCGASSFIGIPFHRFSADMLIPSLHALCLQGRPSRSEQARRRSASRLRRPSQQSLNQTAAQVCGRPCQQARPFARALRSQGMPFASLTGSAPLRSSLRFQTSRHGIRIMRLRKTQQ